MAVNSFFFSFISEIHAYLFSKTEKEKKNNKRSKHLNCINDEVKQNSELKRSSVMCIGVAKIDEHRKKIVIAFFF